MKKGSVSQLAVMLLLVVGITFIVNGLIEDIRGLHVLGSVMVAIFSYEALS